MTTDGSPSPSSAEPVAGGGAGRPLVIVGPTASGKSSLALSVAEALGDAEIVSADAMAVYRGMDIGTASPSAEDRRRVAHHLVDVVEPTEDYTVARFQEDVTRVVADLERRGRRPIVVGGTGLYVRAVVDEFTIPGRFPEVAAELELEPDTAALHRRLAELDPPAAAKMLATNRRRILRALEVTVGSGQPFSSFGPGVDHYGETRYAMVGLQIERDVMDRRIEERYRRQLEAGFVAEVERLAEIGPSRTAGQALGYRELLAHVRGDSTLDEAIEEAVKRTRKFARRQQRWFRRDPRITWFDALEPELADRVVDWVTADG